MELLKNKPVPPATQTLTNGTQVARQVARAPRGRDILSAAIRLRVRAAVELRDAAQAQGLGEEHWGPSAVASVIISVERQGVRGIDAEVTE